jgi:anaerobic magnesium-protoporphyrin IX monomethyl ester cyclase
VRILFFYRGAESFGIEYLSAVLTQAGHHTELIYDPGLDNNFYVSSSLLKRLNVPKKLVRKAKDFSPDLVAFSSITNLYPYVKDMARALKAELKVPTVIGGIHPTVLPELVLQEDCFDIVCRGEGEYALLELANRLERGEDIADIENLWVKDSQGVIRENEQRPLIQDLDALPFPDKALFYRNGAFWRNVSIMTGRGCPYHCTFCVNSFYHQMNTRRGGMVRRRSVDNVIQELKLYKQKYRPQTVNFQDDTFSVEIDWLEEFADKYAAEVNIPFQCNVHPMTVTREIIKALKKAGCRSVCMGIQSGNSELRKMVLKRPGTNERIIEASKLIKEAGIQLVAEYIFGLPDETPEKMWESATLNRQIRADNTSTFVFYPFPGTALAEYCVGKGLLDAETVEEINNGVGSYHTTLFIKHPYRDFALNMASLLPLFSRLPSFLNDGYLKKLCSRKHGLLAKTLGVIGVPFMNTWQARERTQNLIHMTWRLFKS